MGRSLPSDCAYGALRHHAAYPHMGFDPEFDNGIKISYAMGAMSDTVATNEDNDGCAKARCGLITVTDVATYRYTSAAWLLKKLRL